MKKILLGILALTISTIGLIAQTITFESIKGNLINLGEVTENNEDYTDYAALKTLLKDVEIVMLGEQSHGEATAYETKIKLIKYLHKELGFDILVFEGGFYDVHKASELIEAGMPVRDAMGQSISYIWSTTKSIIPLAEYLETNKLNNPLKLRGFDSQFYMNFSKKNLLTDLSNYLKQTDESILNTNEWQHLKENFNYSVTREFKKLKRNQPELDTTYLNLLVQKLNKLPTNAQTNFWIQTLKNVKVHLSDLALGTDDRDKQMAKNLVWLKEQYPKSKIICWGATSHFLYNSTEVRFRNPIIQLLAGNYLKKSPRMGNYVKEKYGAKVYTIGFTAFSGSFGLDKSKKIKPAKKGTFEFLLSQSEHDNFLVPFKGRRFKNYPSRPLGNAYMKNDIGNVMDAVIFNRNMLPTKMDIKFFAKMYPENKYFNPKSENE